MHRVYLSITFIILTSQLFGSDHAKDTGGSESIHVLKYSLLVNFLNNPAYAGMLGRHVIGIDYQSQWVNMSYNPYYPKLMYNPRQLTVSYDMALLKKKKVGMGLGILYHEFQFNTEWTSTAEIALSVRFKLGKLTRLSLGATFLSYNYIHDIYKYYGIYPDQIDPTRGAVNPTNEHYFQYYDKFADLKTGIWLEHKKLFSGISFLHLKQVYFGNTEGDTEFGQYVPMEIQFITGKEFGLNKHLSITPSIEVKKIQYLPYTFTPSCFIGISKKYMMGISYYNFNQLNLSAGLILMKHLSIQASAGIPLKQELRDISNTSCYRTSVRYIFNR